MGRGAGAVIVGVLGCGAQVIALDRACEGHGDCGEGEVCVRDDPDAAGVCDEPPMCEHREHTTAVALVLQREVDVLFVIDNSGSMAEEQIKLAAAAPAFFAALDRSDPAIDYRIAFTTTDSGNPWCTGTMPEHGAFVISSCRSRPAEFVISGNLPSTVFACLDTCPAAWAEIPIAPTATAVDPEPRPRPWIEGGRTTNLPDGLAPADAFACIAPQGIVGCGFESQLESMDRALRRALTSDDDAYGFVRPTATLAVVIVTDELDCSANPAHEEIFLPEGDRVFWSNPAEESPTSAVCWNAGVACTGGPGMYDACVSIDRDVTGAPTLDRDAAVLYPVARYREALQAIALAKQELRPRQEIVVAMLAGVNADGTITYADTDDAQFQEDFGIGPGCQSQDGRAAPPVRMVEIADAFRIGDTPNLFSICADDYAPALATIADTIVDQFQPHCLPACVADADPTTEVREIDCALIEETPQPDGTIHNRPVPPCTTDATVPADASLCWIARTDGNAGVFVTDTTTDDLHESCREAGWNVQLTFVHEDPASAPSGMIKVHCAWSCDKPRDCPALP